MEGKIYEVVVIGGGIMGSSTAYFLSKEIQGENVLLLEQFDLLHRKGSSHGESRVIRMSYAEEYNTALMPEAYKLWDQIQDEANTKLLTTTGGLTIGPSNYGPIQDTIKNLEKCELDHSILTPETIGQKYPMFRLPSDHIAVFDPKGGILHATKAVATLHRLSRINGVTFRDNTTVTDIKSVLIPGQKQSFVAIQAKNEVSGEKTLFHTKKVVITAGAWTQSILRGINLNLQPKQVTNTYWKIMDPSSYEAFSYKNFPVFVSLSPKNFVYGTPALEYPSMMKCSTHLGENLELEKLSTERSFMPYWKGVEEDSASFLRTFIKPGTFDTSRPSQTESCLYTISLDHQFIVDEVKDHPDLNDGTVFLGAGFSGHGFKFGPVIGKILANLAINGTHPYPFIQPYHSASRF